MRGRECAIESGRIMELVASSSLSAYDCEYAALAGPSVCHWSRTTHDSRTRFPVGPSRCVTSQRVESLDALPLPLDSRTCGPGGERLCR